MNKVILIGNITKDVELTKTTTNISVARMTLAVPRKFKNAVRPSKKGSRTFWN